LLLVQHVFIAFAARSRSISGEVTSVSAETSPTTSDFLVVNECSTALEAAVDMGSSSARVPLLKPSAIEASISDFVTFHYTVSLFLLGFLSLIVTHCFSGTSSALAAPVHPVPASPRNTFLKELTFMVV
jgi:hypothetical protein